ncbi:MAG: hypothetical protein IJW54_04125 [Clostridia bacterium]|nr:hypothetical protein [Clostridia bacterium]
MSKYVAIGFEGLTEDKKFIDVAKLCLYDNETDLSKAELLIESLQDLPQDIPYRIYFFSVGAALREEIINSTMRHISFSDTDTWKFVSDEYLILLKKMQIHLGQQFKNVHFAINLSFGDFCLLIPYNYQENVYDVLKAVEDFLNPQSQNDKNIWEKENDLVCVKQRIFCRLNTQYIYRYTPHIDDYKELFTSLLNADVDTTDKAWELARQASVLLYTFLEEIYRVWLYPNGEPKNQTLEYKQDIKRSFENMRKNYQKFLSQVSSSSIFADSCWSYSFICDALLSSFVGQSVNTTTKVSSDEFNDFHGFMPIISQETKTMESFFCEQFGVLYSTGFLLIPYNAAFNIWKMIPSLIHEFSHYISTPNRKDRNDFVLYLTFCSVIDPLIAKLKKVIDGFSITSIVKQICEKILERYDELATWVIPYRKSDNGKLIDSMYFLNETMDLFEIIDFEDLYDYAFESICATENIESIPSNIKDECIKNWNESKVSYLLTYTMALREIRSDIAMCYFLDIDLEEYILLMANEPTWAKYSWDFTADSVFLRFGFMTRYLVYNKEPQCTSRNKFNSLWEEKVDDVFLKLINDHSDLKNQLNNMRGYVKQYIKINLAEEYECDSDTVVSIFEKNIFPMPMPNNAEREQTIVGSWEKQFKQKSESSFIHNLNKCYKEYTEKNNEERIIMNYQSRLIMRDLFMFFPDVDE